MTDATAEEVAHLLTAEAALVCRPFAGAVALAAGAAGRGPVAVPRDHLVRLGGVSLLELIRVADAAAVEVGDADGFAAEELAAAGAMALLVAARSTAADMATALWACRSAGTASVAVASEAMGPLALLDAAADLVVVDVAEHCGGPSTGIVAGCATLVRTCADLHVAALFRADAAECAATLEALRSAAGDPAAGSVMPLAPSRDINTAEPAS
jgi:seryl-tRNA(Sec) selenium transferase